MRIATLFVLTLTSSVALAGDPTPAPSVVTEGAQTVVTYDGLKPGAKVSFLASTTGPAAGPCFHSSACLGLGSPTTVGFAYADRDGVATMAVPAALANDPAAHFQVVAHGWNVITTVSPVFTAADVAPTVQVASAL